MKCHINWILSCATLIFLAPAAEAQMSATATNSGTCNGSLNSASPAISFGSGATYQGFNYRSLTISAVNDSGANPNLQITFPALYFSWYAQNGGHTGLNAYRRSFTDMNVGASGYRAVPRWTTVGCSSTYWGTLTITNFDSNNVSGTFDLNAGRGADPTQAFLRGSFSAKPQWSSPSVTVVKGSDAKGNLLLQVSYAGLVNHSSLDSADLTVVSNGSRRISVKYLDAADNGFATTARYGFSSPATVPAGRLDVELAPDQVLQKNHSQTPFFWDYFKGQLIGIVENCPVLQPRRTAPTDGKINPDLAAAVARFEARIAAEPGVQTFAITSGVRDASYQAYLYEMRTAFKALDEMPGVEGYVLVDGAGKRRPQLRYTGTPPCLDVITELSARIIVHKLVPGKSGFAPGVNPPDASLHGTGDAVDIAIGGLTPARIAELAKLEGLKQPYDHERHHFELAGTVPRVQLAIHGNSPINLLVTAPDGRRIGYDAVKGAEVHDWPGAEYSGMNVEPQRIYLPLEALEEIGSLSITGIGTGNGPYTVLLLGFADSEEEEVLPEFEQKLLEGAAQTGIALPPISHTLAAAPPISIKLLGGSVQISFTGILQRWSEARTWVDLDPQPTSPVTLDIQGRSAFWRARLP